LIILVDVAKIRKLGVYWRLKGNEADLLTHTTWAILTCKAFSRFLTTVYVSSKYPDSCSSA